jgi:arginase family enzyme
MQTRILDLDDSIVRQQTLVRQARAEVVPLRDWGPSLRLACAHGSIRRFEDHLTRLLGSHSDNRPFLSFLGSGDFHHVSLALLRRLRVPCNLLVIDNHPDWMRGVPFLHCGTWLYHAAQLPAVARIFHVGGDVDFDNAYRWLAPWSMLRSGKIVVAPARRRFRGRRWANIENRPLRRRAGEAACHEDIEELLNPFRVELAARPLYISLDKDVLPASEAMVNWDSGHLTMPEVLEVLEAFVAAAGGELAGMDGVGDWSPIRLRGLSRRVLHWTEHPSLTIHAEEATRRNERLNLRLLERVSAWSALAAPLGQPPPSRPDAKCFFR